MSWHLTFFQLEANKREMEELQKSWEEKLTEAQQVNLVSPALVSQHHMHVLSMCSS